MGVRLGWRKKPSTFWCTGSLSYSCGGRSNHVSVLTSGLCTILAMVRLSGCWLGVGVGAPADVLMVPRSAHSTLTTCRARSLQFAPLLLTVDLSFRNFTSSNSIRSSSTRGGSGAFVIDSTNPRTNFDCRCIPPCPSFCHPRCRCWMVMWYFAVLSRSGRSGIGATTLRRKYVRRSRSWRRLV